MGRQRIASMFLVNLKDLDLDFLLRAGALLRLSQLLLLLHMLLPLSIIVAIEEQFLLLSLDVLTDCGQSSLLVLEHPDDPSMLIAHLLDSAGLVLMVLLIRAAVGQIIHDD